jgi:hypothetical protein
MTERTFHTPEPIELEVKIPAGEIEVETVDGDQSTVLLEGPEKLLEQTRVELVGNRLVVELEQKGPFGLTIMIGDWSFGRGGLRVHARVPYGSRPELVTASADLRLRGRYGSLQTKSVSGDLVVDGGIERDADVKTVSGDARLGTVGGRLTVQSVSGDVTAASVGGDVTAKFVSGDLRLDAARAGHVTVQSVSGDIEIGVAPGTNLDVDAGSVSGDLTSEVPLGSEAGADGEGPTLVVRGKTVSGDFKVFRAA